MRALKIIGIILGSVLVILILIGGYLGFVPGVSAMFGSNKPKDLGITTTAADTESGYQKLGVKLEAILPTDTPDAQSIQFEGQTTLNATLTDREMTALLNDTKWKYYPVTDMQVKIGTDGRGEASGIIRLDRIRGYAAAYKVPQGDVDTALNYLSWVKVNPTFYVSGTGSVTNNQYHFDISTAQVGRLSIPAKILDSAGISSYVTDRMKAMTNYNIRSATFVNGGLKIDADVHAIEKVVPK